MIIKSLECLVPHGSNTQPYVAKDKHSYLFKTLSINGGSGIKSRVSVYSASFLQALANAYLKNFAQHSCSRFYGNYFATTHPSQVSGCSEQAARAGH